MNEEMRRTQITYPVTTACFSINENREIQDLEFAEWIAKENLEFGFINMYMGSTSTLSSCCRLRSDTSSEFFNSFGAGSSKIGSLGVVTINFPRLAIIHGKEGFKEALKHYVEMTANINQAKREVLQDVIDKGCAPIYNYHFAELSKQYSTTGVNGLYEALVELGYDITTEEGQEAAIDIMKSVTEVIDKMQEKFKAPHNCEQIPGENTSIKFAKKDNLLGFQHKNKIYSNQFVPLTAEVDILTRIYIQGKLDGHFSGGSVLHINVDERIKDYSKLVELIKLCAKQGCIYFAINYCLNKCVDEHLTVGKVDICPVCGKEIKDRFTRVVGFLTSVKSWHKVRRELDFPNRKFYGGI